MDHPGTLMNVIPSDEIARDASLTVSAASTMWFYLKSWLQDLRDSVELRDTRSIDIISWQIEETAISLVSAIKERRIFRIDIDDSSIVFGTRIFSFVNGLEELSIVDEASALTRIDAFERELSSVITGNPDWIANAIEGGHLKVLRSIARELSIVAQFGVESIIPEDWLL
jgi:hypothetical protein